VLERIIGTKSKIRILRKMVEAEEREFCLEDLVITTGQSFGTVHPALKDLVESRIVLVKKIGRSKLYRINTRHLLYSKIRGLILEEKAGMVTIAKKFSDSLEKAYIENVILFGSAARGESTDRSDIDVLIIYSKKRPENDVAKAVHKLLEKYDVEIVPIYLSVREVKDRLKRLDRFILSALDEGKVLYGDAKWLGK
jgi:predicted nucleotidyltransferase